MGQITEDEMDYISKKLDEFAELFKESEEFGDEKNTDYVRKEIHCYEQI